ncbi:MAG: sigma-54-dependent Fis family transcriptional regulator [Candidatus Zixiibacteriota bacterium]|nr:MAG: sigma-54-dependent Fis family transcriptional regulator [candidate division Zixibacteria bacterium]
MKILIVDDEPNILASVGSALKRSGHDILTARSYSEAESLLHDGIDVALLDVWLGEKDGIQLLKLIKDKFPEIECVMISGHAEIETAVSAVKLGAYDFLEKPLSLEKIDVLLSNIARLKSIEIERDDLRQRLAEDGRLVGQSKAIIDLKAKTSQIAPEESRVLITGENGTGKELVARMIHSSSPRKNGPFVAVNCAALPDDLIESELFGYEKGAFTGAVKSKPGRFEMAGGGTLFLDEIGEMSEKTQAKLLRAVEEGAITRLGGTAEIKIDVRIISATNKNLKSEISEGNFREDLFYRLAVLLIEIPPLRERRDDIPLLVQHFSDRFCQKRGRPPKKFETGALKLFLNYPYPGNIRELANYVERVVIMAPGEKIGEEDIESYIPHLVEKAAMGTLKAACEQFEIEYIKKSISQAGGNMTRAADILGLERSHLYKKMKSLGIDLREIK